MDSSVKQLVILVGVAALAFGIWHNIAKNKSTPTLPNAAEPKVSKSVDIGSSAPILDKELAPTSPRQSATPAHPQIYKIREYELTELAYFDATGLVLSTKQYPRSNTDKESHRSLLSPMDIAIGWGEMSNPAVLNHFRYYQSDRFFHFANYTDYSAEAAKIHSDQLVANIHIIPASTSIANALENIEPNMIVRLVGSLVEIRQVKNNYKSPVIWRSSLSRLDQGDGACELLYLKRLEWNKVDSNGFKLAPLPQNPQ